MLYLIIALSVLSVKYCLLFFFSLGLLGTIFGLCVATTTNLTEAAPVAQVVAGLKEGLNTAFYTTICGIIFSLPLQVQLVILKFKLEEPEKDD